MIHLKDLVDDPKFKIASPSIQRETIKRWHDKFVANDPSFVEKMENDPKGTRDKLLNIYAQALDTDVSQVSNIVPHFVSTKGGIKVILSDALNTIKKTLQPPEDIGKFIMEDVHKSTLRDKTTGESRQATTGEVLGSLPFGLAFGTVVGIPKIVGQFAEFLGSDNVGRSIKEWAEEKERNIPEMEGPIRSLFEGGQMLGPSVLPGLAIGGATIKGAIKYGGKTLKEATKLGMSAGSYGTGILFGGAAAQQTIDNAKKVGINPGAAPYIVGLIEGVGEAIGTKYLMKLFGFSEGAFGFTLKNLLKTLGVEITTEMGQAFGQSATEKLYNISPDANPMEDALSVIGPTAVMSTLAFGIGNASSRRKADVSDKDKADFVSSAKDMGDEIVKTRLADIANRLKDNSKNLANRILGRKAIDALERGDIETAESNLKNAIIINNETEVEKERVDDAKQIISTTLVEQDKLLTEAYEKVGEAIRNMEAKALEKTKSKKDETIVEPTKVEEAETVIESKTEAPVEVIEESKTKTVDIDTGKKAGELVKETKAEKPKPEITKEELEERARYESNKEHQDTKRQPLLNNIVKWLMYGEEKPKQPDVIYGGVLDDTVADDTSKYVHATPWYHIAEKGGKFGGGSHKIKEYKIGEGHKFYRGGSLEGDPIERTRIPSVKGMTWDDILNSGKAIYEKEFKRLLKEVRSLAKNKGERVTGAHMFWIRKHAAEKAIADIVSASYETDAYGKEGKWASRSDIPKSHFAEVPKLRTKAEIEAWDRKLGKGEKGDSKEDVEDSIIKEKLDAIMKAGNIKGALDILGDKVSEEEKASIIKAVEEEESKNIATKGKTVKKTIAEKPVVSEEKVEEAEEDITDTELTEEDIEARDSIPPKDNIIDYADYITTKENTTEDDLNWIRDVGLKSDDIVPSVKMVLQRILDNEIGVVDDTGAHVMSTSEQIIDMDAKPVVTKEVTAEEREKQIEDFEDVLITEYVNIKHHSSEESTRKNVIDTIINSQEKRAMLLEKIMGEDELYNELIQRISKTRLWDIDNVPIPSPQGNITVTDVKMTANLENMLIELRRNIINSRLELALTNELFQNALDAMPESMERRELSIRLSTNDSAIDPITGKKVYLFEVKDNGNGMSLEDIQNKFLRINEKGKAGDTTIGGHGAAKAGFLLTPARVRVKTTKDGMTHFIDGTGIDFTKSAYVPGVDIKVVSREALPDEVGTTVRLYVHSSKEEAEGMPIPTYDGYLETHKSRIEDFIKKLIGRNLYVTFERGFYQPWNDSLTDMEWLTVQKGLEEDREMKTKIGKTYFLTYKAPKEINVVGLSKYKLLKNLNIDGNEISIYSEEVTPYGFYSVIDRGYSVHSTVYNKELWMHGISAPSLIVPDKPNFELHIVFGKTMPILHPRYPFTKNRENLISSVEEGIKKEFRRMQSEHTENRNKTLVDLIQHTLNEAFTVNGVNVLIETNDLEQKKKLQDIVKKSPKVFSAIADVINKYKEMIKSLDEETNLHIAITLDPELRGYFIAGEHIGLNKDGLIAMNPFIIVRAARNIYYTHNVRGKLDKEGKPSNVNKHIAAGIVHLMIHEYAHVKERHHGEGFEREMHRITQTLTFGSLFELQEDVNGLLRAYENELADIQEAIEAVGGYGNRLREYSIVHGLKGYDCIHGGSIQSVEIGSYKGEIGEIKNEIMASLGITPAMDVQIASDKYVNQKIKNEVERNNMLLYLETRVKNGNDLIDLFETAFSQVKSTTTKMYQPLLNSLIKIRYAYPRFFQTLQVKMNPDIPTAHYLSDTHTIEYNPEPFYKEDIKIDSVHLTLLHELFHALTVRELLLDNRFHGTVKLIMNRYMDECRKNDEFRYMVEKAEYILDEASRLSKTDVYAPWYYVYQRETANLSSKERSIIYSMMNVKEFISTAFTSYPVLNLLVKMEGVINPTSDKIEQKTLFSDFIKTAGVYTYMSNESTTLFHDLVKSIEDKIYQKLPDDIVRSFETSAFPSPTSQLNDDIQYIKDHFAGKKTKYRLYSGGMDSELIMALGRVAAHYIKAGIRNFEAFSKDMIEKFGENVKKHLDKAWKIGEIEVENAEKVFKELSKFGMVSKIVKKSKRGNTHTIKKKDGKFIVSGPNTKEVFDTAEEAKVYYKANNKTLYAPGVSEAVLNMVKSVTKDVEPGFLNHALTNMLYIFKEFDRKNGTYFTELLYWEAHKSEKTAKFIWRSMMEQVNVYKKMKDVNATNMMHYAAMKQLNDKQKDEYKKLTGLKSEPILNEKEMEAYTLMRNYLDDIFAMVNRAREMLGEKPINYRGDYFTFIRVMPSLLKDGFSLFNVSNEQVNDAISKLGYIHPRTTKFPYEKRSNIVTKLDTNIFRVFSIYSQDALRYAQVSKVVSFVREIQNGIPYKGKDGKRRLYKIGDKAPIFHNALTEWADYLVGADRSTSFPTLERIAMRLSRNVSAYILGWSYRAVIIQPSAVVNAIPFIGVKNIHKAIVTTLYGIKLNGSISPLKWYNNAFDKAREESDVLIQRQHDVISDFIDYSSKMALIKGGLSTYQQFQDYGFKLLQAGDSITATIVYMAAKMKAEELGLDGDSARRYADEIVIMSQGSASRVDAAKLQRSKLGKAVTLFQTFSINQWNMLTREIFGSKNATLQEKKLIESQIKDKLVDIKVKRDILSKIKDSEEKNVLLDEIKNLTKDVMDLRSDLKKGEELVGEVKREYLRRALIFFIAIQVANFIYEDILKLLTPYPDPLRRLIRGISKERSSSRIAYEVGSELFEWVPGIGSAGKYGSNPMGAVVQHLGDITKKLNIEAKGPQRSTGEILAKTLGIPGGGQFVKSLKQFEARGGIYDLGDAYDVFAGTYRDHERTFVKLIENAID